MRALFVCLLLAFPAEAETITIRNNGGGNISDYRQQRRELAKADAVEIRGWCYSACAIFTTLPNACVYPEARIGFHGADLRLPFIQKLIDNRMGEFFRGRVAELYDAEWRHLRGDGNLHIITGRQLHRLDPETRICE